MAQEVRRVGARRTASLVLVVLGTVLLFVGGIALYVREEIFDPDAFAQHASESLGDDRVDAAVANPIVDEVIKVGPDQLINGRPLLTAAARGVLRSEPFREAFRDAAARVHRMMAENDNGEGSIPWYHDGFELMQETPYTFDSADALRDPKSCKPNRGTADSPLFQFNHWVEKVPRSPDLGAEVNAYDFLVERARECRRRRGLLPNLVAVDFYDEGDIFEASRKLNGLPRDAEPKVRETG